MKKITLKLSRLALVCAMVAVLPACAQTQLASHYTKKLLNMKTPQGSYKVGNPYQVAGKWYTPEEKFNHVETGVASWYGPGFHGKLTANGEVYDQYELTAAHKTLQMPSLVKVTNLENGRSIVVRVNDRGPFKTGRIIDLSSRGADLLGFKNNGIAKVRLEVLENESRQIASAAKSGQDIDRFDVASLNRQRAQQPDRPEPEPARLLDDAEAVPLPESLRPEIVSREATMVSSEPVDASVKPVEVASLSNVSPRVSSEPTVVGRKTKDEMSFLNELDFMKDSQISGHEEEGRFMPDPVVKHEKTDSGDLYIQAGSFSSFGNAERLAVQLANMGVVNINEALVDGQQFYRVRIGPMRDVEQADMVLAQVADSGQSSARIIVD
ncbi:MAG: septal ring lytic transglycosylase RlpA family protein [Pseudomonadota bacterium]